MVTNTPTQINSLGPDLYDQNDPKGKERTLQFQIGRGELENPNIFMRVILFSSRMEALLPIIF